MNHTYRVVFNETTGTFVAVSELAQSKGKTTTFKSTATKVLASVKSTC